MNKRFCVLLGVAILGVVISHTVGYGDVAMFYWPHRYRDVISPNFDKLGSLDYYLIYVIRQLMTFSVASFLFVSGYFVSFAGRAAGKINWTFVKNRILNLLIPYTIWSLAWLCFYFLLGRPLSGWTALKLFFTKGVTNSYFYVPLLCSFYLLSPFLFTFAKKNLRLFLYVCFFVPVGFLAFRYLSLFVNSPWVSFGVKIMPDFVFYRWILFFGLGLAAGLNLEGFKDILSRNRRLLQIITPVFLILVLIEPEVIYRATATRISWKTTPFPYSGMLYAISFIFLFLSSPIDTRKNKIAKFLWSLGNKSYALYLLHYLFLTMASKVVYHFVPELLEWVWPFCIMLFVAGLGGPLLLMALVRKTPLKKYYRYIFG